MMRKLLYVVFCTLISQVFVAQSKQYSIHTVAFYNLENLFDTHRDETIYDEEWTPEGARHWNDEKYHQKLHNLSRVISQIGTDENKNMPTLLGVSEIENRKVLEDLIAQPELVAADYGIVHFDSPDRRGIDVGLLYQKKYFTPITYKNIPLYIYDSEDRASRVYTRDQLVVTGLLEGEMISLIVNHWPSRSGGEKRSSPKREAAAALNKKIIDSLYQINKDAKIITMGDLNDGPYNKSVSEVLGAKKRREEVKKGELYNPMYKMYEEGAGTIAYRDAWDIFDQMILSEPLLERDFSTYRYWKANIFIRSFMLESQGTYKGYPLRNQSNGTPGFSDHFPVYVYLIKEKK